MTYRAFPTCKVDTFDAFWPAIAPALYSVLDLFKVSTLLACLRTRPALYPVTKTGDDEDMRGLGYLQAGVITPVLQNR